MTKAHSLLGLVILAIACGGTTEAVNGTGDTAGTSSGGSSSHAGSGAGGKSTGGTHNAGGTSNVAGSIATGATGGSIATGGSGVGGGTVDERCPPTQPVATAMCSAEDEGALCHYDQFSSCLCAPQQGGPLGFCPQVDPNCPNDVASAGTSTGGAATGGNGGQAATAGGGIGGIHTKIAVPQHMACSCSAGHWLCSFRF
jgi:hypothetical protein